MIDHGQAFGWAVGQVLGQPVDRIGLFDAHAHLACKLCSGIQTGKPAGLVWPGVGFESQEGGLV